MPEPTLTGLLTTLAILLVVGSLAWFIAHRVGFFHIAKRERKNPIRFWPTLGAGFLYLISMTVVGLVLAFFLGPSRWILVMAMPIGLAIVLLFASLLGYLRPIFGTGPVWRNIGFGIATWPLAFPIATFFGQIVALILFLTIGGVPQDQLAVEQLKSTLSEPLLFSFMTLMMILVVPITEEILFRGFLQSWLRNHFSLGWSIGICSLIFALCHCALSQGWANIEIVVMLFTLSCFIGYIYERQRSLWAPIGLHAIFNGLSVAAVSIVEVVTKG